MSKYNRISSSSSEPGSPSVQPLIYSTYQAYLRRTESHLVQSLHLARANGFSLGVKLVRGAYHPHEITAHAAAVSPTSPTVQSLSISPDALPPVWHTKPETDACYNAAVRTLIELVREDVEACRKSGAAAPAIGALFGTHNWESADLVVDELMRQGLAKSTEADGGAVVVGDEAMRRVAVAQLYGACFVDDCCCVCQRTLAHSLLSLCRCRL